MKRNNFFLGSFIGMNVMVIFLFVIPLNVLAQNAQPRRVIKGEITDDKGEALSGVNISVKVIQRQLFLTTEENTQ